MREKAGNPTSDFNAWAQIVNIIRRYTHPATELAQEETAITIVKWLFPQPNGVRKSEYNDRERIDDQSAASRNKRTQETFVLRGKSSRDWGIVNLIVVVRSSHRLGIISLMLEKIISLQQCVATRQVISSLELPLRPAW